MVKYKWPQESIDKANQVLDLYRKRKTSQMGLASQLYNGDFLEITYGFGESFKSGQCGKFLHEIVKECECFTKAGVDYLVAKLAGLKPQLYHATGIKDVDEGADVMDVGETDHLFITVNIKGKPYILDPFLSVFDQARFEKGKNQIFIGNPYSNDVKIRSYSHLERLSEQKYLEQIHSFRKPGAGRKVLEASQRISGQKGITSFITYVPGENVLTNAIRFSRRTLLPFDNRKSNVYQMTYPVLHNGDLDDGRAFFSFCTARALGWSRLSEPLPMSDHSIDDVKAVWNFFDVLLEKSGRKTRFSSYPMRLEKTLHGLGVAMNLEITKKSRGSSLLRSASLRDAYHNSLDAVARMTDQFLKSQQGHEQAVKYLHLDGMYWNRTQEGRKVGHYKYIFSDKDHDSFLRGFYDDHCESIAFFIQQHDDALAMEIGLQPGSRKEGKRRMRLSSSHLNERAQLFAVVYDAISFNKGHSKYLLDRAMCGKDINFDDDLLDWNERACEDEIQLGARYTTVQAIKTAYCYRQGLALKQYRRGLKRLFSLEE